MNENKLTFRENVELQKLPASEFIYSPSCYCIAIVKPEGAVPGKKLTIDRAATFHLTLPALAGSGSHHIDLTTANKKFHRIVWNYNVVDDVSVSPRFIQYKDDAKRDISVTFRSSERSLLEECTPKILDSNSSWKLNLTRSGEIQREVGNVYSQVWTGALEFFAPLESPEQVLQIMFIDQQENQVAHANFIVKSLPKLIAPKLIDFGKSFNNKEIQKRVRIGKSGSGVSFSIESVNFDSVLNKEKIVAVEWNADKEADAHWLTFKFTPRNESLESIRGKVFFKLSNGQMLESSIQIGE